jgi:tetratricopeptide (TPR) repeat protein
MLNRFWLALAAVTILDLTLASEAALAQREFDQLFVGKGAPSRGFITEMMKDHVTLDISGLSRQFDVSEIVRITFKDEPPELNVVRTSVLQRNYMQALADLKKTESQKIDREFIKHDIDYYRALCLCRLTISEGGDKAAATAAMLNFVKSAPESYHFYEAAEVLGDLAMASGKWADATRYYGPIANAKWPDYQMRANNAIGRALLAENKFDEALDKFRAVTSGDAVTPEATRQKNLAQVGRALCVAETGKAEEAVAALDDMINKNDSQDAVLFARVYNALGRCYIKLNKPRDAVTALLHTDMLYSSDADAHAEALYYLSKVWSDINKSERAVAARNALRERYAGSFWATLE